MSDNVRPFEVGDMVVGHTVYRPKITIVGEIISIEKERPVIHVEYGDSVYIDDFVIKCVRKPRNGGKEARDIVAMLGWSYRNHVLKDWKKYGATKKKKLSYFYNLTGMRGYYAFNKAKSMLKEDL